MSFFQSIACSIVTMNCYPCIIYAVAATLWKQITYIHLEIVFIDIDDILQKMGIQINNIFILASNDVNCMLRLSTDYSQTALVS